MLYTNLPAGFSILYPEDWVYYEAFGSVYFAETEEALDVSDPSEVPILVILTGSPEDIEDEFGSTATPQDLLDAVLEDICGEECEVGESETWVFGETPGAGVDWSGSSDGTRVHGYLIAAVGEEVVGIGLGVSPEADWPSYEPIFLDMFASLEIFPPEEPEPVERGTIQPGETVEGTLSLGGVDIWNFDAQKGQYVTIRLDAADPYVLDTYLELYDAGGFWLADDDDSGMDTNSVIAGFLIADSGTYYIHASAYDGEGDYTLTLEIAEEPSGGGEIEYGETAQGTLALGDRHEWTFDGEKGDVVTIAMNAGGDQDTFLELYGPDDVFLTDDDDSGEDYNALIEYYELPSDGTYRIVACGGLFGVEGAYELTLRLTQMVIEGTLDYGDEVEVTLTSGTRHHWLFDGERGDVVTISMTSDDFDTYLELFAPDGVREMYDDDSGGDGNAEIFELELPLSGTYRIIARGYGDDDVGKYTLILTKE